MRSLSMLLLAAGLARCLPAAPPQGSTARELRAQAVRLAAARRYDEALRKISVAQAALRAERARVSARLARPEQDPRAARELRSLDARMRARMKAANGSSAAAQRAIFEYEQKRGAIFRAAAQREDPQRSRTRRWRLVASQASFDLRIAELDDLAASWLAARGDAAGGRQLRLRALSTRVRAYQSLRRLPEARAAAEKLAALGGDSPPACETAARFFQSERQFARAAEVWRTGILAIESGRALRQGPAPARARQSDLYLTVFYRQLAFCLSRSGRQSEVPEALRKASEAEARASARR